MNSFGVDFGTRQLTVGLMNLQEDFEYRNVLSPIDFIPEDQNSRFKTFFHFFNIESSNEEETKKHRDRGSSEPQHLKNSEHNSMKIKYCIKVVARMLFEAKKIAEKSANTFMSYCVIAIPASLDDTRRHIILTSARLVGLKANLVHNCSAFSYGSFSVERNANSDGLFFFSDVGIGKLECSLIKKLGNNLTVLWTCSDFKLGLINKTQKNTDDFLKLISDSIKKALQESNISDSDLVEVQALVHGSGASNLKIQEIFEDIFKKCHFTNRENCNLIAYGAALKASAVQKNKQFFEIEELAISSRGIECLNTEIKTVIPKNHKYGELQVLKVTTDTKNPVRIEISENLKYQWGFEFDFHNSKQEYYHLIFNIDQDGILEVAVNIRDVITKYKRTLMKPSDFEFTFKKMQKEFGVNYSKKVNEARHDLISDCRTLLKRISERKLRDKAPEARKKFREMCCGVIKWIEDVDHDHLELENIQEVSIRLLENYNQLSREIESDDQ